MKVTTSLFRALRQWFATTGVTARAIEEMADYRYEDYAQDRFDKLERHIALLEQQAVLTGSKPR